MFILNRLRQPSDCTPIRRILSGISILMALAGGAPVARAAELNCSSITPASLAGKTLWFTVSSGTAPYANSGSYRIELRADGTFVIPAGGAQTPQSGTWSASVPSTDLVVRFKGFLGDSTEDVLALFAGCLNGPACSTCGFSVTREGLPGIQQGDYTVTDGEAPAPASRPKVTSFTGGGSYPVGGNAVFVAQVPGNPASYRFKWYKDDVQIAGQTSSFLFINPVQLSDAGLYRVEISNAGGTVNLATRVTVVASDSPLRYLGRPWRLAFGGETTIPRQPSLGGTLPVVRIAVRGGSVYALDGERGNWLTRDHDGTLTTLVAANDPLPDGTTIRSISNFTVDTNGVVVVYGQASDAFGLSVVDENGIRRVTRVGQATPAGNTTFTGFGPMVIRGGRLFFTGTDSLNKQAIYSWDGTAITTFLEANTDLPGVLGNLHQILTLGFDGTALALTANDTVLLNGNHRRGVFRGTLSGVWRELANVQTPVPSTPSQQLRQIHGSDTVAGTVFFSTQSNLGPELYAGDASGRFRLFGPSHSADLVSAQFAVVDAHTVLLRNVDQFTRIDSGLTERLLGVGDVLGGRTVSQVYDVAADGEDAAIWVGFADGTRAVYAATGGATIPTVPLVLGTPTFVDKALTFSLPTVVGTTYRVEVRSDLTQGTWATLRSITGDGTVQKVSVGADGVVGFVRLAVDP